MTRPGPIYRLCLLLLAAGLAASSCAPGTEGKVLPESAVPTRVPGWAGAAVAGGKNVQLLLLLDPARVAVTPRSNRALTPGEHERRVRQFVEAKKALFSGAPQGLHLQEDYDQLPLALVEISSTSAWDYLEADPRVLRLAEDEVLQPSLESSLSFIRQPQALAEGKDGTGVSVAVLDTGANYTVPALGSCTAPGVPAATCRVPVAKDFAAEDGVMDDNGHGTNVSAIVAGVAPGARILALDVFTGTGASSSTIASAINWVILNKGLYNIAAMNMSLGSGGYTAPCPSQVLSTAIDEARKAGILSAVATGNSSYTNAISQPACAPSAVSVGAVHDGSESSGGRDQVAYFSNSAYFMTLLAPGVSITAGGITMQGTSQATPHVAGALAVLRAAFPTETPSELVARLTTSGVRVTDYRNGLNLPRLDLAAAAAGCVLQVSPETVELTSASQSFDVSVTTGASCSWTATSDTPEGLTVTAGASGKGSGTITLTASTNPGATRTASVTVAGNGAATRTVNVTQRADATPPTGSIRINGDAAFTQGENVTLAISGSDADGVASMCVSNSETCAVYEPFATTKSWTLGPTQGLRTVRLYLKDGRGNVSPAITDTITLDSVPPSGGALSTSPGPRGISLGWTAPSDDTSGVAGYRLVFSSGAPPASCSEGSLLYDGPNFSYAHSGLATGATYGYRLCAVDNAGNTSTGVTASASPMPDKTPPTGTLLVNGGAAFTSSATVALAFNASDESAVTGMCLSTTTTCAATAWEAFTTSVPAYALPSAQGPRKVYAWLRDEWGNTTSTPLSASITVDSTAPTGGVVTANFGHSSVSLTWTAASDGGSGIGSYRVVFAEGTPPATCAEGALACDVLGLSCTHTGLANGTTYGYRLCPVDKAGNVGTGGTASASPRPDGTAPTGTLVLNSGSAYTTTATIPLDINATDASAISSMCISTTSTCATSAWKPFTPSLPSFALPSSQGVKKVSVWLKDEWGNTTAVPLSSSITLDTAPPTRGTLTATPGDQSNVLGWTASTDGVSGLGSYRAVFAEGAPPASCSEGTLAYEGAARTFTHSGLANGTIYGYRLCAVDKAGNVNTGVTASARPRPETTAPTGTVTLNGGALFTTTPTISVDISASDASTITEMCLGTSPACATTAWKPFSASLSAYSLPASQGLKRVYVRLRDEWGNTTSTPLSASITLDSAAPSGGTLRGTAGSGQVSLSWSAAADAGSGLSEYKLVYLPGSATPAGGCRSGTVLYEGMDTSFVASGLTGGAAYAFRLCAVDKLGNTSTGSAVALKTLP